jgi:hypothetical protein
VYVGGAFTSVGGDGTHRHLTVLDRGTGALVSGWTKPDPGMTVRALETSGDRLYVQGAFGEVARVVALDKLTGAVRERWQATVSDGTVNSIAVDGGRLYVGGSFDSIGGVVGIENLAAIDKATGRLVAGWRPPVLSHTVGVLAVDSERLYLGGIFTATAGDTTRRYLAAVDKRTGAILETWQPPSFSGSVGALLRDADRLYVGGQFSSVAGDGGRRYFVALDSETGAVVEDWSPTLPLNEVRAFAVDDDYLYLGGWFTTIMAISKETGALKAGWSTETFDSGVSVLAIDEQHLYVGGRFFWATPEHLRYIRALDRRTGALSPVWSSPYPNGGVEALAVDDRRLYAGGSFNQVNRMSNTGDSSWRGSLSMDKTTWQLSRDWRPPATGDFTPAAQYGVYGILTDEDHVYLGGGFDGFGDYRRGRFVVLRKH